MDINGTLSNDQIRALSTVYLVSLSPSLIGSSSVLVVSIARWRHLQQQVLPLVQLALADLLAGLILMFTSAMNIAADLPWLSIHSKDICQHALPLSLTFYFVSFLLVVVYAWKSMGPMGGWRTQGENVREEAQCRMRKFAVPVYAFVWFIPITLYIAYVITNVVHTAQLVPPLQIAAENRTDEISEYCSSRCIMFLHTWHHLDPCQLNETWHDIFVNVFLFLAVIPVLVYCSVIYYKVRSWYHRHTHEQEGYFPVEGDGLSRRRLRTMFSTARKMVLVIIICWAPVLVLIVMSNLTAWVKVQQWILFVLYIIQAVFMSLHGFLNSIVYAWSRANFTEAVLGESTPLAHDRQPFYDESLPLTST